MDSIKESVSVIHAAVDIGSIRDKDLVIATSSATGSNIEVCNVNGKGRLVLALTDTNHTYASKMELIIDGKSIVIGRYQPLSSTVYSAGYIAKRFFRTEYSNGNLFYYFNGNMKTTNAIKRYIHPYELITYIPGEFFMGGTFNDTNSMPLLATDVELPFDQSLVVKRTASTASPGANDTYVAYYLED